jgi:hypothetical protein
VFACLGDRKINENAPEDKPHVSPGNNLKPPTTDFRPPISAE